MPAGLLLEGKILLVYSCGACLLMIFFDNLNGCDDRRSGFVHVHHVSHEGLANVRVRCACTINSWLINTNCLTLRDAH